MSELSSDRNGKLTQLILKRLRHVSPLFLLTVVVPTLCAILYFGLFASDVYISESRYTVRTQAKQAPTGLASLLTGSDISSLSGSASGEVAEYALSRDAMKALNDKGQLAQLFSRPEIDFWNRMSWFGRQTSEEDLYSNFTKHVALNQSNQSGITTLVVRAYRPEDARWINARLLDLGEQLVNRLNQRSREDLVKYARQEADNAREQSGAAAVALAEFRNRYGVIDPEKQANVSLQMISKLQDEVILTKTQLAQMQAYTPQNPQIPVLGTRIESLNREIDAEMLKVAGGKGSLAAKSAQYTRLAVDAEYADKLLANALVSLQNANNDARRQQAYVERIVQPNLPDRAAEPRRMRGIFSVAVLGLVVYGVLTLLLSAMREHNL